jgi:hypothetical protein
MGRNNYLSSSTLPLSFLSFAAYTDKKEKEISLI